jgi:hypothetical protein
MHFYPEDYNRQPETWDPDALLYASSLLDFSLWDDEYMASRSRGVTWLQYEMACKARERG